MTRKISSILLFLCSLINGNFAYAAPPVSGPLGNTAPVPGETFSLSIENAIDIGLKNNLSLLNAEARRELQKFDLRLAERRFVPLFTIESEVNTARSTSGPTSSELSTASLGPRVATTMPTGATITARINGQYRQGSSVNGPRSLGASIELNQPLLRGNGLRLNEIPIQIAQNTDDIAREALKALYNQMAVTIFSAYYDAILAEKQLEIARQSYERSLQLVANNTALIDAGRLARTEIEQAQADVSVQNRALLDAERRYDEASRALLLLLNLPSDTDVNYVTPLLEEGYSIPDINETIKVSREFNPGYAIAHLGIDIAHQNRELAQDTLLPDLSLVGGYNYNGVSGTDNLSNGFLSQHSQSDWRIGLRLSIPLNDLNRKRASISAKVSENTARNDLILFDQRSQSEIQRGIANLKSLQFQRDISKRGVEYSQRAVEAENAKFQAGRSSNFQVLLLENSLNVARQNEVRDTVAFLKAIIQIEFLKGTILNGWEVADAS